MGIIALPLILTSLAGMSTVLGGFLIVLFGKFNRLYLSFFLGASAGAMVYLSFMQLLPESVGNIGSLQANAVFFLGIACIGVIDRVIPHHYENFCAKKGMKFNKILLGGYMTALGIIIHNFPEGIAVFMSSLGNIRFGSLIAMTTAVHNIPEGIAIASPILYATGSRRKALKFSLIAGIAEPFGAILAYIVLAPFITPQFLSSVFAFIAGVMVYLSFDELLPTCFEHCNGHTSIAGIVTGMLVIAISLNFA